MRILHTGDLNITAHMNQKMNENLLKFLSELKNSGADLLIVAGVIGHGQKRVTENLLSQYGTNSY